MDVAHLCICVCMQALNWVQQASLQELVSNVYMHARAGLRSHMHVHAGVGLGSFMHVATHVCTYLQALG